MHLGWIDRLNIIFPRSEFDDIGNEIIAANNLEDVSIKRFSAKLNRMSFERLTSISKQPFVCPSTGFLAFFYITQSGHFENFEKFIFGFTFEMWSGHPADSERHFFHEVISARIDIKIIN